MEVKFMEITPELAVTWLQTSKGNPRWKNGKIVTRNKVVLIANDIKKGNWNPSNNSIAFDDNGVLVDGHHRLTAIIEAGIPVYSLVVFGLPQSSLQHIDENNTRQTHQRIGTDSQIVAAGNFHFWLCGEATRAKSSEVISDWLSKHPLVYTAKEICIKGGHRPVAKKSYVIHGTLCALEYGVIEESLYKFFTVVNSGFANSEFDSPAIVLRNMLLKAFRVERSACFAYDYATQAAIKDYNDGVQRKRAYTEKSGFYFDELVKMKKDGYYKC